MKKFTLFCAIALAISAVSIGCNSDGSSSWCRSGSLFPTSRSSQQTERVYMTSGSGSQCDPCNPCEQISACSPCEPVCNPCDMSCTGGVVTGGITPHPSM